MTKFDDLDITHVFFGDFATFITKRILLPVCYATVVKCDCINVEVKNTDAVPK